MSCQARQVCVCPILLCHGPPYSDSDHRTRSIGDFPSGLELPDKIHSDNQAGNPGDQYINFVINTYISHSTWGILIYLNHICIFFPKYKSSTCGL